VGLLLFFYLVHVAGVRWFGRLQVWMCVLLGISIVVLVVPGLFAVRVANLRPFFTHGLGGFAASLPLLFFAYAGFEALAQTAGEVKEPTRILPRIFLGGIVATTVIYLLMSVVALGVLPAARLQVSNAPMAEAAAMYLPAGAAGLVTLGALMALATSVNATMLVPSRIAVMLADDGLAPRWVGAVWARTGTPVAGLTITLIAALLLLLTNQIGLALNIAVFALVILYLLHSLALLVLPGANPELFRSVTVNIPLGVQRFMAILSMTAMALLIALQVRHDLRMLRESLTTIELTLFWGLLGLALYALRRRVADGGTAGGIEHA
jgi:amino acid transporter